MKLGPFNLTFNMFIMLFCLYLLLHCRGKFNGFPVFSLSFPSLAFMGFKYGFQFCSYCLLAFSLSVFCLLQVTITPEVASRTVNRAIMAELVRLYKESDLGMRLPAYDGRKSLYTAGELPFAWKEFNIKLLDEDGGTNGPKYGNLSLVFPSYCSLLLFFLTPCGIRTTWVFLFVT